MLIFIPHIVIGCIHIYFVYILCSKKCSVPTKVPMMYWNLQYIDSEFFYIIMSLVKKWGKWFFGSLVKWKKQKCKEKYLLFWFFGFCPFLRNTCMLFYKWPALANIFPEEVIKKNNNLQMFKTLISWCFEQNINLYHQSHS